MVLSTLLEGESRLSSNKIEMIKWDTFDTFCTLYDEYLREEMMKMRWQHMLSAKDLEPKPLTSYDLGVIHRGGS